MTDNEYIQRVERLRGNGWEVKLRRGTFKKTRLFGDVLWGGTEAALLEARAWRDEKIKDMPRAARPRIQIVAELPVEQSSPSPKNSDVKPEKADKTAKEEKNKKTASPKLPRVANVVRRESKIPAAPGRPPWVSAFWIASWTDTNGLHLSQKFSVNYLGEEVSRQKAMEAHEQQLRWAQPAKVKLQAWSMPEGEETNMLQPEGFETRNAAMRCIQRLDTSRHAWKVQIKRAKVRKHKYFPDTLYGGREPALAAAKAWREHMLAEMDGPGYEVWKREHTLASNTTGIPGVFRGVAGHKRGGEIVQTPYWQGYWTDMDGKRQIRVFSILAHGEDGAKALAVQARRQGLEQVAREAALKMGVVSPSRTKQLASHSQ